MSTGKAQAHFLSSSGVIPIPVSVFHPSSAQRKVSFPTPPSFSSFPSVLKDMRSLLTMNDQPPNPSNLRRIPLSLDGNVELSDSDGNVLVDEGGESKLLESVVRVGEELSEEDGFGAVSVKS